VLDATGSAKLAMAFSDDAMLGAIVTQVTENAVGDTARVVLSGFSYHQIRDDLRQDPNDQVEHLLHILQWLENGFIEPKEPPPPATLPNVLAQNYPNPFNPTTTIRYSIGARSHVSIKIYNIAGQRVKTLVNDIKNPIAGGYAVDWDGRSDKGAPVASGVYLYEMITKQFTQSKKMVLVR
jgi:hypothetical protein